MLTEDASTTEVDEPSADNGRKPLLVFIHIPKTAGTTLRGILNVNVPGEQSRGLNNVFKGGGGVSESVVDRLLERPIDLKDVGLVRGHVPLGVADYIGSNSARKRPLWPFAFLREPVDRTLSHFFRVRESTEGGYRLPPLPEDATIADALAGGYIHDNLQTRMLCGDPKPFGTVDDEMLEQAKSNLTEKLAFFGLTERFDESLVLAKRRLGFASILYRDSGRVNKARPRGEGVPEALTEEAAACNAFDLELYAHARGLFDATPDLDELEFRVEVAALAAAKVEGEIDLDQEAPAAFDGNESDWRLLLGAQAQLARTKLELARKSTPRGSGRAQKEALKSELEAMKRRNEALAEELEERKSELRELKTAAPPEKAKAQQKTKAERGERKRRSREKAKPKRAAKTDGGSDSADGKPANRTSGGKKVRRANA